ncbi:glycerol-3-phosphate acyltransferase 2, mitochondrial [Columba livia]|uniref:Glycerol-3-phosphate acyltransferase 2, mitochondrial n=1 Tax=Columba livia TaxID=8932 RepID=A0A2I0LIW0_COLLI|nr:glycerol-3-phosphate acyltransferase 2, mitochondrial [Columba livia]
MKTWLSDSGQKLEIFIPFLGKYRPSAGRCCQTCTPKSWDNFYQTNFSSLGFRDAIRLTEEDTRYRGWLVRRVCGILVLWGQDVPDTPRDLATRICRRVRSVSQGSGGASESQRRCKEEIQRILAGIQAPLARPLLSSSTLAQLLHRYINGCSQFPRFDPVPHQYVKGCSSSPSLAQYPQFDPVLHQYVKVMLPYVNGCSQYPQLGPVPQFDPVPHQYINKCSQYTQFDPVPHQYINGCSQDPQSGPVPHQYVKRAVRDVTVVPVGIAYDVTPGDTRGDTPALGMFGILRVALGAGLRNRGCARVDFGQPFSLQEFAAQGGWIHVEPRPEEPPGAPGTTPPGDKAVIWGPSPTVVAGPETEEETLVTRLGLHALSDTISCSAVTAVGITSALLLHKYRGAVLLSRLLRDFGWLLEEILLRQHDVGFSGQLRALVRHSLALLSPRVTLLRLAPRGDALVLPAGSAEAQGELRRLSAAVLPVFACEAVGACAIRALLLELLPFLGSSAGRPGIVLSQDELGAAAAAAPEPAGAAALPAPRAPQPRRPGQAAPVRAAGGRGARGRALGLRRVPAALGQDGFQRQRQRRRRRAPQTLLQAQRAPGLPWLPPLPLPPPQPRPGDIRQRGDVPGAATVAPARGGLFGGAAAVPGRGGRCR